MPKEVLPVKEIGFSELSFQQLYKSRNLVGRRYQIFEYYIDRHELNDILKPHFFTAHYSEKISGEITKVKRESEDLLLHIHVPKKYRFDGNFFSVIDFLRDVYENPYFDYLRSNEVSGSRVERWKEEDSEELIISLTNPDGYNISKNGLSKGIIEIPSLHGIHSSFPYSEFIVPNSFIMSAGKYGGLEVRRKNKHK